MYVIEQNRTWREAGGEEKKKKNKGMDYDGNGSTGEDNFSP